VANLNTSELISRIRYDSAKTLGNRIDRWRNGEGHLGQSSEAPEVIQALAKAEYGRLTAQAKTAKDRNDYERLRHKWLGIADGWRVITEVSLPRTTFPASTAVSRPWPILPVHMRHFREWLFLRPPTYLSPHKASRTPQASCPYCPVGKRPRSLCTVRWLFLFVTKMKEARPPP
jgi:hypothetical protein